MRENLKRLENILRRQQPLLVAYSGGVDSSFLLARAHRVLGEAVLGVIADSPSLPREALEAARRVAEARAIPIRIIATEEFSNPEYLSNPPNRCYFCKAELFSRMEALAEAEGFAAIAYGENADDPAHLRPGSQAAARFQVLAPLKEAGLTKAHIRTLSREMGLPTADSPAQPCLSSRIPHGTPVTTEALALVERGEALVRSLGFRVFRVRFLGGDEPGAKLQIAPDEMDGLPGKQAHLEAGLRELGFATVEIDPLGYRAVT